jgi:MFS family permease
VSAAAGGRLADRFGQRVVAFPGGLLFAAGCLVFAAGTGATPRYASEFLPATLLTGTGVGLSFAAWGSAAVAELPPSRFATGSAISATSRQIGAVLGIAVLVAVIGTPAPGDALDTFHRAWVLMAIPASAAGLIALALGRVRARNPEAAVALAAAEA